MSHEFAERIDEERAYQRWVAPHGTGPDDLHPDRSPAFEETSNDVASVPGGGGMFSAAVASLTGAVVGAIGGVWVAVQWIEAPIVATDGPWIALIASAAAGGSIAGVAAGLAAICLLAGVRDRDGDPEEDRR